MTAKATTRLPLLPREIRDAFKPDPTLGSLGRRARPERDRSDHSFARSMTLARLAAVVPGEIKYYRGKAQRGGYQGGTEVFVLAVYKGHVVARYSGQVYRRYDHDRQKFFWYPTLEVYRDGDAEQRTQAFAAREHEVAKKMGADHRKMVADAKKSIAKAAHEAKASTKLAHLRKDIAEAEKALKKLRAEETKLARLAEKEAK